MIISLAISMLLIKNIGVFDKVMIYMLLIIEVTLMALYSLFKCVQEFIDELIINNKIKEKIVNV